MDSRSLESFTSLTLWKEYCKNLHHHRLTEICYTQEMAYGNNHV